VNEPVKVGELIDARLQRGPVLIPKRCPECGKGYEGYSFLGLRPGETRATYPCDDCFQRAEDAARMRERGYNLGAEGELTDLRPPRRVGGE
jgi:hypothetical protein